MRMSIFELASAERITEKAKLLFKEERMMKRLDGWFHIKEIIKSHKPGYDGLPDELQAACLLKNIAEELPISLSENAIFAGTQRDSFARSYALINPAFEVESFSGYCDPTAVFDDIEPGDGITAEKIAEMREYDKQSAYVRALDAAYGKVVTDTSEVAYFIEQVTGHLIPDMRPAIKDGVTSLIEKIDAKITKTGDVERSANLKAMKTALEAVLILAGRYAGLAGKQKQTAEGVRRFELELIEKTLRKVPANGAKTLYEAIQSFMLLWQVMCLEQAPNPFAFSVGNADRIFEPYRVGDGMSRKEAASLFKHFLVFFNVGDKSWAISQNVLVGGKSNDGKDLTNPTSYALLDAYFDMNLPQPILSVKLHKNTPGELYESLGRFFFTPGCLTPSLFNDDTVFEVLRKSGVEPEDLEDYSVAGCQEPLIMGKDNGNTTNSWLNLGKILELTLSDGVSTVTGKRMKPAEARDARFILENAKKLFFKNTGYYIDRMVAAANDMSEALSNLPVPYLSALMDGIDTSYDLRDTKHQGTKYNGSGCLIHGLSVVADSLMAIECFLEQRPQDTDRLMDALKNDFEDAGEIQAFLLGCPKYGNNIKRVDDIAADICNEISDMIASRKNYLGNPFRPDWSTPSTHLLYGYWVGATPDGRKARSMLNYGIDPLHGDANSGLGFRALSAMRLPFEKMPGGYASHFGINPRYFKGQTHEEKGMEFKKHVIEPLFFNPANPDPAPFYLYVNVTTPETLRKVLANPEKYAPGGVYIMRIHGTFVNFLDLSPAIQNDIIMRLDLESTTPGF